MKRDRIKWKTVLKKADLQKQFELNELALGCVEGTLAHLPVQYTTKDVQRWFTTVRGLVKLTAFLISEIRESQSDKIFQQKTKIICGSPTANYLDILVIHESPKHLHKFWHGSQQAVLASKKQNKEAA